MSGVYSLLKRIIRTIIVLIGDISTIMVRKLSFLQREQAYWQLALRRYKR